MPIATTGSSMKSSSFKPSRMSSSTARGSTDKRLDKQAKTLQRIEKKVDKLDERLQLLQPQTYLHPIPKPRQGREVNRTTNVAAWMRKEIERLNQDNRHSKYFQFPDDVSDRRLNADALREIGALISFHIPHMVGQVSWEDAYKKNPRECEMIVREARLSPEFTVFAQAAGQWAIRTLCANKMRNKLSVKNKKRHAGAERNTRTQPNAGTSRIDLPSQNNIFSETEDSGSDVPDEDHNQRETSTEELQPPKAMKNDSDSELGQIDLQIDSTTDGPADDAVTSRTKKTSRNQVEVASNGAQQTPGNVESQQLMSLKAIS